MNILVEKKINKEKLELFSERIILRTLYPKDITDEYINSLNDRQINEFLVARLTHHTKETARQYMMSQLKSDSAIFLGIFVKENGDFIGTLRISLWEYHFIAGMGILIFSKHAQRKGFALEAIGRVVDFVFRDLGYRCVEAQAHCDNLKSVQLFKRCGFEIQSRICGKYRHRRRFVDIYVFNKYNPDFDAKGLSDE